MNNDFNLPPLDTWLEGQPHGGALKRSERHEDMPLHTAQDREDERMGLVPAIYKTKLERLAVELALRMEEPGDIFARYGYDEEGSAVLMELPAFQVLLSRIGAEIAQNGLSFKAKIRAIAEDLLPTAHSLASDPLISPSVRADLIKWAGKMAGHEPKEEKGAGVGGGGFNMTITFAGQAPMKVVSNEPLALEA